MAQMEKLLKQRDIIMQNKLTNTNNNQMNRENFQENHQGKIFTIGYLIQQFDENRLRKARIDFKKYSRVFPKDFFGVVKTESDAQEHAQEYFGKVESHSGLTEKQKMNATINSHENISSTNQLSSTGEDPSYRKQIENCNAERNNYSKIKEHMNQHRRCKSEADSPVKEPCAANNSKINKQSNDIDKREINKLIQCKAKGQFQSQLSTHDNYCAQQSQKNTPTFISEGTILNKEQTKNTLHSFQVKNADPRSSNEILPKTILLKRSFHKNNSPKNKENKSIFQSAAWKGTVLRKSCHMQTKSDVNMNTTTSLEQNYHDKLKMDPQQQNLGKENSQEAKSNPFLSRIESAKQFQLYNLICNQQDEILKEQLNHGQLNNIQQNNYPFDEESLQQFSQQVTKQGKDSQESQLFRQCTAQTLRNVLSFQRNEDMHQYQLTRCQTERSERDERLGEQKHFKSIKEQKDKYAMNLLASRIETVPSFNGQDQKGNNQKNNQIITKISSKLQSKSEKKLQAKGSVSVDTMNYTESSQNYSKVQTKSNNSPLNKGIVQKRERCSTSEAQINRIEYFHNEFIDDKNFPIVKLIQRQRLKRRVSEAGAGILEGKSMPAIKKNNIFSAQVDHSQSSNKKLEQLLKSSNTSEQLEFSFKNTGQWQAQELISSKLQPLIEKEISHKISAISDASNKAILNSKQCFYPSPVSNIKNQHTKKPVYSTKLSSCALRASAQK